MLLYVALSVTLAAALTALILTMGRVGTVRRRLEGEQKRGASLERQMAGLERQVTQLQADQQFLVRFLREFPHVAHELHNGKVGRKIPNLLLNLVVRILEPAQAVVIVRRRSADGDPERRHKLVVAAAEPQDGGVAPGTEITLGEGPIGFAAEIQRVMDRRDFDQQPPDVKSALRAGSLPGFDPDFVAPLISEEETMGVLAIQGVKRYSVDPRDVLRVIALTGALAVRSHERLTAIKTTASLDGLTGIFNKRFLSHRLSEEVRGALDEHQSLSVFLFDIDNFKHYNDRNGHMAGDQLLRELARLVQANVRRDSLFGRFGGEEFILVLPGTGKEQALAAAENVRRLIAEHSFAHGSDQPLGCLSISGGVSTCPEDATESAALLKSADEALYAAKHGGRNRVERYVPRYLGGDAQEPVEPADIPEPPEDFGDDEDDAEATGPMDPALLPGAPPTHGAPAPSALLPRGGEAPRPVPVSQRHAPLPSPPLLSSGGEVRLLAAGSDELVAVDDHVLPADEAPPDPPEAPKETDHLTFGPAWIEPV